MITDLNKILVEWAYQTSDGKPNVKNKAQLIVLEKVLKNFGWPSNARAELLNTLMEQPSDKERLMKQVIKYKSKDGEDKEITVGGALKQGEEHPAYEKAKQITDTDDDKPQSKGLDADDFDRFSDKNKTDDKEKEDDGEEPTDSGEKEPSEKQIENEKDKRKFLKTTVDLLIQELKQTKTGAGAREMDKEQWVALKNFAEGKGPKIRQYEVSEQDIDDAIDLIKSSGKKGVMSFLQTKGAADPDSIRKGTEDNPGPGWNRDRKMIKSFLACGGLSAVTGKPLSIGTSNVDHRLSLENGGKDEPENWIWMETEMNMNKSSLTDEQLIERAKKALAVTDDEKRKKQLINIIKNESKKFVTEHYKTLFELGGNGGITEDELKGMTIPEIKAVVYGWNKVYPKTSDLYINYYAGQKAGSRGAGGRGVPLPKGKLINNVIEQLNKKERVLTSEEIEALDGQLQEGIEDIKREAGK